MSPRLRRQIAVRLLEASTDDRLRSTLNTLVRNMPVGTYAELLPEKQAWLRDRALRLRSSALVARLSDQGADALPLLLNLLTENVRVEPWAKRQWMLADIRRVFPPGPRRGKRPPDRRASVRVATVAADQQLERRGQLARRHGADGQASGDVDLPPAPARGHRPARPRADTAAGRERAGTLG